MSARLYIEGGESKQDQIRCREGFRTLLERAGFKQKMPRLIASGSRNSAFDDFRTALSKSGPDDYVAMLIDSEEVPADGEKTWAHLKEHDAWEKPGRATDKQVLFMTTCMETWILADVAALRQYYRGKLQESALPPVYHLETRNRHELHERLEHATRECANPYAKGRRSFKLLEMLNPEVLSSLLPSFDRAIRVLKDKL